jgi:hypothetical protein
MVLSVCLPLRKACALRANPVKIQNRQNGLPQDRRLRKDGFIILAQAAIRADGCRPRKIGEGLRAMQPLRAPRANHVQIFRIETIRKI